MKKVVSLLFFLVITLAPISAQTFRFTAIPDENSSRLEERFDKVAVYLSDKLGIDVEYIPVKTYSASIAAFKYDQVQLAWFGGLAGVRARRAVPGSKAIAQGEEDSHFVTYFIAHKTTGLLLSEDFPDKIKEKTFTFGSKGSTSGRLMPEYFIRQHFKKSPRKIFKRVGFSGDHSKTIALVQAGSYQVGVVNYKVWENEIKAGKIDLKKIKVIWKTPAYVDYNWTLRGDVDQKFGKGFSKKLQDLLLNMKEKSLLESFPRKRFIPANNSMYQSILETGIAIGIIDK